MATFLLGGQSVFAQSQPFCSLKGPVFLVDNMNQAQYRVFIEKSEAFADLPVYKAPNALFADKSGLWFFTATRAQASFTIVYVTQKSLADFSIFFTDNEAFAGCK